MDKKYSFQQFTEAVVERIREFLPETFANASVELSTVKKNNGLTLTGLTVRTVSQNVSPTIYLEHFFDRYQEGEDISEVLERIAELRVSHEVEGRFDTEEILDFERVRDRIVPKLINHEWNRSLLEERVHKVIAAGTLAVTYQILLQQDFGGNATIAITNQIFEKWPIDIEALHELAIENMRRLTPSTFEPMSKVLEAMMDEETAELFTREAPEDEILWIISNKSRINGAAAVLDSEFMKKVEETFAGSDYCLLCSSVHEWIAVKADTEMDTAMLRDMIVSVNTEQVSLDERLGDTPFIYTTNEGLLPV